MPDITHYQCPHCQEMNLMEHIVCSRCGKDRNHPVVCTEDPKNIYVAKDGRGRPTSVLLAESREKAEIFWAGMGESPIEVEEISPDTEPGIHGVAVLLSSAERRIGGVFDGEIVRVFKRGL